MSDADQTPVGYVPHEWMDSIEIGMAESEILSRLGEPYEKLSPGGVNTPSDFFESFGSMFRPSDDEGVEEIWTYRHFSHPHDQSETRRTSFLGIADHVLQSFWEEEQMPDEKGITGILTRFFDAMGAWEASCTEREKAGGPADNTPEAHEQAKAESIAALKEIFELYCTTWDDPKRAVGGTIHYSTPPVYGADLEDIQEITVSDDTARVVTKQKKPMGNTFVYSLKRTGRRWRIEDNRKRLIRKGVEEDYDL